MLWRRWLRKGSSASKESELITMEPLTFQSSLVKENTVQSRSCLPWQERKRNGCGGCCAIDEIIEEGLGWLVRSMIEPLIMNESMHEDEQGHVHREHVDTTGCRRRLSSKQPSSTLSSHLLLGDRRPGSAHTASS